MHHAAACRFTRSALAALIATACFALPAASRADLVYVISKTTGGLYRFDSGNPAAITTVFGSNSFNQPSALALGADGHLYIGESPGPGDGDPRILRYVIGSGSFSEVVNLSGTAAGYTGDSVYPAAIAFRRAVDGGEMLVGRNPDSATYAGPVMAVSGWDTASPFVTAFTSGSMNASPGLAVSPATGNLYASNVLYGGGGQALLGTVSAFDGTQNPAPFEQSFITGPASGPLGLFVSGSTLYSTNPNDGSLYQTNLTTGSSTLVATTNSPFDVGTLAQLSDGDFLTGSLYSGQIYRISTDTASVTPLYGEPSGFGQIGGIVTMVVPEPGSIALAVCGLAAVAAWRRRHRTVA